MDRLGQGVRSGLLTPEGVRAEIKELIRELGIPESPDRQWNLEHMGKVRLLLGALEGSPTRKSKWKFKDFDYSVFLTSGEENDSDTFQIWDLSKSEEDEVMVHMLSGTPESHQGAMVIPANLFLQQIVAGGVEVLLVS
jgi:hypothetical protein